MGGTMDMLVGDIFAGAARAVPRRVAVTAPGAALRFHDLDASANRVAGALRAQGIGLGDRVVVWADSAIEVTVLFAGLAKMGAVFVPLNGRLGVDEATPLAQLVRPALVVVDAAHIEGAPELAQRVGATWLHMAGLVPDAARDGELPASASGSYSLARLAAAQSPQAVGPIAGLTGASPHVIFFTSGSTGRPKGVVLSHRTSYLRSHPGAQLEPRGGLVCAYPLFHMAAWTLGLQQWHARDTLILPAAVDGKAVCEAIEAHGATRINLIPAMWQRVLDHVAASGAGRGPASLRFADTGTSATPPELLEAIAAAFPDAVVRVFYGSTESGNVAALEAEDFARKPGRCGVPSPGVAVRLSADGELLVRSTVMFDGYFDDPGATEAAFADGWYRSGDRGELDDEGYLSITGRTSDLIRTGGEAVSPGEVERVIARHPAVASVAVVGLPDPTWGQVVCAAIVLKREYVLNGESLTLEVLRAHCSGTLASYKQPRRLEIVDDVPRTASTGQIQRNVLIERLLSVPRVPGG